MTGLERHADGLWSVWAPLSFFGLRLGTRMAVVRLPDGGLWLHSAVPVDDALVGELDALGPVRHVVAPNTYHHLHAAAILARWPGARLHAPEALRRKRPDLRVDATLGATPDPDWGGVLDPVAIEGTLLHETVFVHGPTRTLITADLVENFDGSPHRPTDLYLKLAGLHGRVGFSRFLRPLFRDRASARRSLDALLTRDFDRIVLAHGRVLDSGGREAVRETYGWL